MTPLLLHRGNLAQGNNLTAMACEACGYTHLSPLPRAEETKARYETDQFYGKDKPDYHVGEERDKEWLEGVCYPTQMALIKDAKRSSGTSLLDVGCGYGVFLDWAYAKDWAVSGIEASPFTGPRNYPVLHQSIEDTEFDNGYFDVIRAAWVLEHLLDPRAALKKMYGWLKPDGALLVIVPNDFSLIQQAVVASGLAKPNYFLHETHVNYWSYATLSQLLTGAGFTVICKFGTYPNEQEILMGTNYLNNEDEGIRVHARRKQMELELVKSEAGRETLTRLGLTMAEAGLGRDMIFVARREK